MKNADSPFCPIWKWKNNLKKQLEAYQNSYQAITYVDDTDESDSGTDFIDGVNEILDAMEEGYAEGEKIANRISKIFKLWFTL